MSFAARFNDARLRLHQTRVRHLLDQQRWSAALTAIVDLAQLAQGHLDDVASRATLLAQASLAASHLDNLEEYRAYLVHYALPYFSEIDAAPDELVDALASVADVLSPAVMTELGGWLTDNCPAWPLGPYLEAHFREVDYPKADDGAELHRIARRFELAAARALEANLPQWHRHATLRRGALLINSGVDPALGRTILGQLDWTQLFAIDQLWFAVSLASSQRWSDRVRAMDILLDLHRGVSQLRPGFRSLQLRDLRRAASTIFKLAGLHLPDAEDRRLEELSQTLFDGEEQRHWKVFLKARRSLSSVATLPLQSSDEALVILHQLSSIYPRRWKPATQRFQILVQGWTGERETTNAVPAPGTSHRRLPVTDAVARVLAITADAEMMLSELQSALRRLNDTLSNVGEAQDAAAARPVALVWSRLLQPDSGLDLPEIAPELNRLATLYAEVAPSPSYGFWALAAHLFKAELQESAMAIAQRARRSSTTNVPDDLRRYVADQALKIALNDGDPRAAHRWLTIT